MGRGGLTALLSGLLVVASLGTTFSDATAQSESETAQPGEVIDRSAQRTSTPAPEVGPLTIEGDAITSLVPVLPGSAALYVVGEQGLYRSTDDGATWQQTGPVPPVGKVAVSLDTTQFLLAGERALCGRGDGGTELNRSTDGGATWSVVPDVHGIRPLAIWGAANLAVGADCTGLLISTDGGQTWQPTAILERGRDVTSAAVVATDNPAERRMLVGSTSEGGTSHLVLVDLADPAAPTASQSLREYWGIGSLAGNGEQLVLGAADGVWLSIDNGANWVQRRNGLESAVLSGDPLRDPIAPDELGGNFGVHAVTIAPEQTNHLFVGTADGAYSSMDAGATWQRVDGIAGPVDALYVAAASGHLIVQTETGVVVAPLDE